MAEERPAHLAAQAAIHSQIAHLYAIERVKRTVFNRAFNQYWNELVVSLMPPDRGVAVLDMMGGTGLLSQGLTDAGYRHVTLVDLSVDMLRFARNSLGERIRTCVADAMRLPFPDDSVDVVVCRGGLHHLPDLTAAMREVRRVLRPGGVFLAFDPCDDWMPIRWCRSAMYSLFFFFDEEHERGLRSAQLRDAAAEAGLTLKEIRKFGFLAYTLSGMEAHLFPAFFARLPNMARLARWVLSLERRVEGKSFLLAVAIRAIKPAVAADTGPAVIEYARSQEHVTV